MAEALGGGASGYFINNYYQSDNESPGRWHGQAAKQLALEYGLERPAIDSEQWSHLFQGYSPDGSEKLVQNAGKNLDRDIYAKSDGRPGERSRKPGWDIAFSAPKSLSVLWSLSSESDRGAIERAHRSAVNVAVSYLSEKVGFTRTGKTGINTIKANPLIAMFDHYDSRANDPQIHTHVIYLNITVDANNQTRSLRNSRPLYTHEKTSFALYRSELAKQLWEQGYSLEEHQSQKMQAFEVMGVPEELLTQFSKRTNSIEDELERRGLDSQEVDSKSANRISLELRPRKQEIPLDELFCLWAEEAKPFGFDPEEIQREPHDRQAFKQELPQTVRHVLETSLEKLTTANNTFTQLQLERVAFEEGVQYTLGHHIVAPTQQLFSEEESQTNSLGLIDSLRVVSVGQWRGQMHYTTLGMLELEQEFLSTAREIANTAPLPIAVETVRDEIAHSEELGLSLDSEQQAAVWYLATDTKGLKVVTGWAGTGKTRIFETVQRIVDASGGQTLGMALAGKAADELERKSHVPSNTIHKTVYDLERQKRPMQEFVEELETTTLNEKTVVLLDEASMVSLTMAKRAFDLIAEAGANVIVIGDEKQLPAVEAGGVLKALKSEFKGVELKQIKRQIDPEQKQLVYDIAEGSPESVQRAVQYLAQSGLLVLEGTRQKAIESMIQDWMLFGGLTRPAENQMIAMTNKEVHALNALAQQERLQARQISEEALSINDQLFHEGDRIVFRPNPEEEPTQFNAFGVRNGAFGTVIDIDIEEHKMTVQLEGSRKEVTLPESFRDIRLGYAATTHVMQGSDTMRAMILIGGTMQNHQQSYVQLSRHVEGVTLYTDYDTAGRDLSELMNQMTRDTSKHFASALLGQELTDELLQAFRKPVEIEIDPDDLEAQWEHLVPPEDWRDDPVWQQTLFESEAAWEEAMVEALQELEDLIEQGKLDPDLLLSVAVPHVPSQDWVEEAQVIQGELIEGEVEEDGGTEEAAGYEYTLDF